MNASFTVDVEQDCPPYLTTWRGIDEGLPALLWMLREEAVVGTFFTTGEVARRFPRAVQSIVDAGHELGCHGDTHRNFTALTHEESEQEIVRASTSLRGFGPVTAFRAPYLQFPASGVPLLAQHGYALDSSEGRHKSRHASVRREHDVLRVPVSVTSSTLRWPGVVRDALFARLTRPVVLFVHPWEFVDLRRERLRFDCRFKTGDAALACARSAVRLFRGHGARFVPMRDLVA
jgi:peptidoglycan-N-acetylglucosamine deacetylase